MTASIARRDFLAGMTAAGAVLAGAGRLAAAPWKTRLHKALIGNPGEATMDEWKAAGYEGFESTNHGASPAQAEATRKLAEKHGLRIHSVMFGWANFNKPESVERDLAAVETALRAARAYGAETVLTVPCRIGGMPMPDPWAFDIHFDEKTGHVSQVAAGDNSRFQKYIEAHNQACDTSRAAIRRLIPAAEKTGVIIALENVWNNLWVLPEFARNFIASFQSPWVQAYFDIGNHVRYAPPQQWIHTLGSLMKKGHIKDFKLNPDGHGGTWAHIREGSIDWPAVRQALEDIGYNGWLSIEDDSLPPKEHSRRLDLIIAGK
jgi:hexulose-6-phosphate isomerase